MAVRIRKFIGAASVFLAAATSTPVLAQSTLPPAGARITRVTDPVMACRVTLIWTVSSRHPGAEFDFGRPRVDRADGVTTVTWARVRISDVRGRQAVVCRAETTRITSLTLAGVETLTEPQPY